jgi:hypothetical protein
LRSEAPGRHFSERPTTANATAIANLLALG